MNFICNKITNEIEDESYSFESIADDLILLSIIFGPEEHENPLIYYRYVGVHENPPLEIGIDSINRKIISITCFIDGNSMYNNDIKSSIVDGTIITNIDLLINEMIIDDERGYKFSIIDNDIFCIFDGIHEMFTIVKNNHIGLLIENTEICGFCILNVSNEILKLISATIKHIK